MLNGKRREPLSGDEDAINCRLTLKTQLYVNGFFPKTRLCDVICLWKRRFEGRKGRSEGNSGQGTGEGRESKRERKTEEGQLGETNGKRK